MPLTKVVINSIRGNFSTRRMTQGSLVWLNERFHRNENAEINQLCSSLREFNLESTNSDNIHRLSPFQSNINNAFSLPTLDRMNNLIFNDPLINPVIKGPLLPNIIEKFDPILPIEISEPNEVVKKEAVTMIVIRRRKMKKHKLKKLRKKMKFVWAKRKQKREYAKELVFQQGQMAKLREAEAFDPVKYVKDKLAELNEVPIPRTWNGRKLPAEVIRNLMNDPLYYHDFKYPYYRVKKKMKEEKENS